MAQKEPLNPFYFLLLLAGMIFTVTAIAYAVVPTIEQKAKQAGAEVPAEGWQVALRQEGWRWLLLELAAVIILGLASMALDRFRRLRKERAAATSTEEGARSDGQLACRASPPAEEGS